MTEPEGERIARLETKVEDMKECQQQTVAAIKDLDGKLDQLNDRVTAGDATRGFVWKLVGTGTGLSSALATLIVAIFLV